MNWRLANSLVQMRAELDTTFPKRDRTSDGSIGDAKHAKSTSDHNPWAVDSKRRRVVTAIDVDRDIAPGVTSYDLADYLRDKRDPRVKYVISKGRMFSSYANESRKAWAWGSYTGANSHSEHMHVSVSDKEPLFDSATTWGIGKTIVAPPLVPVMPAGPPRPAPAPIQQVQILRLGSAGKDVGYLQRMLGIKDDKDFGPLTLKAVVAFQRRFGLAPTGMVDPATWMALRA